MNKRSSSTGRQVKYRSGESTDSYGSKSNESKSKYKPRLIGGKTSAKSRIQPQAQSQSTPVQSPKIVHINPSKQVQSDYSGKTVLPAAADPQETLQVDEKPRRFPGFNLAGTFMNIARYFVGGVVGIALVFAGFFSYRIYTASRTVIDTTVQGSSIALVGASEDIDPAELQHEGDSRFNVLLVGIRDDDDGFFDGTIADFQIDLADTIIIASIDPVERTAGLFSIPRDLYVDIPEFGSARINNATQWGEDIEYPGGGIGLLMDTVEQNLQIPLDFFAQVNLDGFTSIVDAVGGVDVSVPETIVDWEFSFEELGYAPPYVIEAGEHRLDGQEALLYSRSRKTSARGDFDRNDRQRAILLDLKDKILSSDTFTDPFRISNILTALTNNLRTNLSVDVLLDLQDITRDISSSSIESIGISTDDDSLLSNANIDGAAVVVPRTGNFNEVTELFFDTFPDRLIVDENATVEVWYSQNYFFEAVAAQEQLAAFGYNVLNEVRPTNGFDPSAVYATNSQEQKFTNAYLTQRFEVFDSLPLTSAPQGVTSTADFVVIIGE